MSVGHRLVSMAWACTLLIAAHPNVRVGDHLVLGLLGQQPD